MQKTTNKSEIYEALYGLHSGIQQFLNSLDFLERAGLGMAFLNGYRLLAAQIHSGINRAITDVLTEMEQTDLTELEKEKSGMSSSTAQV